ncbi:hypothetical protein EXIGLDRAFT_721473 [Exidia glandulosa HHB12029]|uniref:Uncharacterized protein n=1 Tax=Exidia glandulosa HHB12029 TaxID=1314781 RepID=A0A165FQA4_EXIGL|nr:hypothetical protein EXIGLDRAFT_721473 [Exidia glandulosa HHB12029]
MSLRRRRLDPSFNILAPARPPISESLPDPGMHSMTSHSGIYVRKSVRVLAGIQLQASNK